MGDVVGQAVGRWRQGPEVVAVVSLGDAVHAGEPPEEMIGRAVLLDDEHDVLDRPSRVERGRVRALGSARREEIGRVAGAWRVLARRREDDEAQQRSHRAGESHRSVMLREGSVPTGRTLAVLDPWPLRCSAAGTMTSRIDPFEKDL